MAFTCHFYIPVHAGMLSSQVIPIESRRQGLSQVDPCPGDVVEFTCTLNSPASTLRWNINGEQLVTFVPGLDNVGESSSGKGYTATYASATVHTLAVNLSESAPEITNGTDISCVESGTGGTIDLNETLIVIGNNIICAFPMQSHKICLV
jgi:hypothetical protein